MENNTENFSNQNPEVHNQPCYDKDGNFLGWFSRSIAVTGFIFGKNVNGEWCVLASQRGEGTPDPEFRGAWNACCGYLDFHESAEEAMSREIYEETGLSIPPRKFELDSVNSDPKNDKRQNVTFRYTAILPKKVEEYAEQFSHEHNEKNEVGEIKFIPISKLDEYRWAFNHKALISIIFDTLELV